MEFFVMKREEEIPQWVHSRGVSAIETTMRSEELPT